MSRESDAYDHFMGYDVPDLWVEPHFYCDGCGAFDESECLCDAEPDPDKIASLIDEAAG